MGAKLLDGPAKHQLLPRALWGMTLGALFFFTLSVFVPWTVQLPPDDLDLSWMMVLQWAHVHRADFGRQLVYTYGPWGFALGGHSPAIFPWVVGVWTFLGVTFFAAIWKLATFATGRKWVAAVWMILAIAVGGANYTQMQDVRLFAMCWLLLLLHFYVDERPWPVSKVLLAAAMALGCQIKFSLVFMAAPVLGAVTVDQIWRRRMPSLLIVFLASYLGFWLAAYQHLASLFPYLANSWRVVSGYAEGASVGMRSDDVDLLRYLIGGLLLLGAACVFRPRNQAPGGGRMYWLAIVALVGMLWTAFKGGYVRHDLHEMLATSSLSLMSVFYLAALWPRARFFMSRAFLIAMSATAIWLAWGSANRLGRVPTQQYLAGSILALPERVGVAMEWAGGGSVLEDYNQRDLTAANATRVPRVQGSVDSYSWGQAPLLLNGLDYQPRPVFQSLLTYTTALGRLNAEFLRSARAPGTIFFEIQPIDYHYPAQEDALSWPELLTRYQPADATGPRLVLRQSSLARDFSLVPIQTTTAELGHWTAVPDADDPIWVTMKIHPTALGRLMRLIYKTPPLLLGIKTRSGDVESYRLIRDVAEGGFLLSPRTWEHMAFATLYAPNWKEKLAGAGVTQLAVSFAQSESSPCFEDQYELTFWRLKFPHVEISQVPGMANYLNLRDWVARMRIVHAEEPPELIAGDAGKIVLAAAAPSRLIFPISSGSGRFRFSFGLLDKSFMEWEVTDGVEFRVYTIDQIKPDGFDAKLAWSRTLDPANSRLDWGPQTAEIQLPDKPPAVAVYLETVPGPKHVRSWSYWTDLQIR
ncbi:MAG: hypothetical protein ABSF29_09610 [Tepidisphaeraceae bacterium]